MCQHLLHPILTSFSQAIKVIPSGLFLSPQLRPTGSNNKVNEFKYSLCFTMFKCFIEPNIKQIMIKTTSMRRKHHNSLIDTRTTAQCAVIFVIPMHFWQRISFKKLWTSHCQWGEALSCWNMKSSNWGNNHCSNMSR